MLELDEGNIDQLAASYVALRSVLPALRVVGGLLRHRPTSCWRHRQRCILGE